MAQKQVQQPTRLNGERHWRIQLPDHQLQWLDQQAAERCQARIAILRDLIAIAMHQTGASNR